MEVVKDFFTELYTFDIVYLVFTVLSLITCTKKGFLLSILSASKWLLAYVVTLFLFPKVKPYFEDIIDSEYVQDIAVGIGLFIIIIFSILILSNFIPTIYFGIFTGIAMLLAMISVLTLLPALLLVFKPFKNK